MFDEYGNWVDPETGQVLLPAEVFSAGGGAAPWLTATAAGAGYDEDDPYDPLDEVSNASTDLMKLAGIYPDDMQVRFDPERPEPVDEQIMYLEGQRPDPVAPYVSDVAAGMEDYGLVQQYMAERAAAGTGQPVDPYRFVSDLQRVEAELAGLLGETPSGSNRGLGSLAGDGPSRISDTDRDAIQELVLLASDPESELADSLTPDMKRYVQEVLPYLPTREVTDQFGNYTGSSVTDYDAITSQLAEFDRAMAEQERNQVERELLASSVAAKNDAISAQQQALQDQYDAGLQEYTDFNFGGSGLDYLQPNLDDFTASQMGGYNLSLAEQGLIPLRTRFSRPEEQAAQEKAFASVASGLASQYVPSGREIQTQRALGQAYSTATGQPAPQVADQPDREGWLAQVNRQVEKKRMEDMYGLSLY